MTTGHDNEKEIRTGRHPSVPRPPLVLGIAGLIPFVVLSGAIVSDAAMSGATLRTALLVYAICILSFMGGVHWGLTMAAKATSKSDSETLRYGISVLPALAGWLALFLDLQFQFAWLALCFFVLLCYDLYAVARGNAPNWYPRLRWLLTIVVCLCLTAVALSPP